MKSVSSIARNTACWRVASVSLPTLLQTIYLPVGFTNRLPENIRAHAPH